MVWWVQRFFLCLASHFACRLWVWDQSPSIMYKSFKRVLL